MEHCIYIPEGRRREIERWMRTHFNLDDDGSAPTGIDHDGNPVFDNPFKVPPPSGLELLKRKVRRLFGSKEALFDEVMKGPRRLDPRRTEMLKARLEEEGEPFCNVLNRWLQRTGLDPVSVYTGADVTKQTWSKLRSTAETRRPSKGTALALVVGFRLNLADAMEFLAEAGSAFSNSRRDLIVRFFVEQGVFNIYEINAALIEFGEKPLNER